MNNKIDRMEMEKKGLTEKIIGCAFRVHNVLGPGFLEKVYENAMMIELAKVGVLAAQQFPVPVFYDGQRVGEYFADIFVENEVICELKAGEAVARSHEVQLVHYLTATGKPFGLLINFGIHVTVKRKFRAHVHATRGQEEQKQSC